MVVGIDDEASQRWTMPENATTMANAGIGHEEMESQQKMELTHSHVPVLIATRREVVLPMEEGGRERELCTWGMWEWDGMLRSNGFYASHLMA